MQATLDSTGLKHWTRALTCLSKFGDELIMIAAPETFALSATNQAQSAYGRFKYARSFFSRYRVGGYPASDDVDVAPLTGQIPLLTRIQPLLQILKHKTIEKSCEKCEFVISDGAPQVPRLGNEGDDQDTLESRLTIRLHCKHGVVKTHRLPLNAAHNLMSPTFPDAALESRVTIGPKALRSMIEHFPFGKSSKSDPQLIWNFRDTEVQLRSLETAVDAKGRAQLSTELTISADEFDEYDVLDTPMTIAFHLKEFNATIAFAEASQLSLEIRFTNPDSPLYIDVGGDLADTLFVIAASQLQLVSPRGSQARQGSADAQGNSRKRPLEEDDHNHHVYPDRNMPVVEREREKRPVKPMRDLVDDIGGAPPSQPLYRFASQTSQREGRVEKEPLFLPASQLSQLPPDAEAAIIASGLGIEHMTAEELEDMLEGDAEEVEFVSQRSHLPGSIKEESPESPNQAQEEDQEWQMDEQIEDYGDVAYGQQQDSFELIDDVEMEPTQKDGGTRVRDHTELHIVSGIG
ncbi:hypothetical protein PYCCODRAFT_1362252 [Trametes coccinea BRFM310]|uniref:Rad9-domain-containing protein n=1 Tax=Trametes coccinea (strain BRFM310) TaxID=1353009 RepID=A0A1Y2IWG1_TRAC3|nr:hypothetical protein PYCCODRAFT_1362252 [Trametes coccinea BRFM310]